MRVSLHGCRQGVRRQHRPRSRRPDARAALSARRRRPKRRRQVDAAAAARRARVAGRGPRRADARDADRRLSAAGARPASRRDAARLPRASDRRRRGARRRSSGTPATWSADAYASALERFLALGGGDLEPRARAVCAELGLAVSLDQETATLSGGEAARAGLAAILLSRFDLLLLDEPTNDLDFDGLDRLERFVAGSPAGSPSSRTIAPSSTARSTRIVEIDPGRSRPASTPAAGATTQRHATWRRQRQYEAFADAQERRREVEALLPRVGARRARAAASRTRLAARPARDEGARREGAPGGAVARADRAVEKPYEPWELQLSLGGGAASGRPVVALEGAVGVRGDFRLGPIDLDLAPGERRRAHRSKRQRQDDAAGAPARRATARRGPAPRRPLHRARLARSAASGLRRPTGALLDFRERSGLTSVDARTLLAKFGLGADPSSGPARRSHRASERGLTSPS